MKIGPADPQRPSLSASGPGSGGRSRQSVGRSPRLVKILERPVGQQFVHFQGLLEFGIAVGYVFRPGAQFVACNSPLSRLEPAVRTPGRPVARLCLLFIHPRAPNLINLRSASTMPA